MTTFLMWWDNHPQFYLPLANGTVLLLLGWSVAALWRSKTVDEPVTRRSELLFFVALLAVVAAWRWPYLFHNDNFNPDESQLIAGAITLLHKPLFWKYVDGHTAGPVDFYSLVAPGLVGLPINFLTARVIALVCITAAAWFSYGVLCFFCAPRVVRLGILPAAIFIATTRDWDFLAVTSEHTPVFLLAAGSYLGLLAEKRSGQNERRGAGFWVLAGFVDGLIPWAKLQAAPAAVALVLWAMLLAVHESSVPFKDRARRLAWFIGAAAFPTVALLALDIAAGEWRTLYNGYVASNISYIKVGTPALTSLRHMLVATGIFNLFQAYLISCAICCGLFGLLSIARQRGVGRVSLGSVGATLLALIIIVIPGRGFPHYLLFAIFPVGLCAAAAFSEWWKLAVDHPGVRRISLVAYSVAGLLPMLWVATRHGAAFPLGGLVQQQQQVHSPLALAVQPFIQRGDTVAMWGWFPQIFVELQVPHATREAHTQRMIEPSPLQLQYRARYMADLTANYPIAVVDAVGPTAFGFHDRKTEGHESFPALARFIAENYTLITDLPEGRVYVRNNRRTAGRPD